MLGARSRSLLLAQEGPRADAEQLKGAGMRSAMAVVVQLMLVGRPAGGATPVCCYGTAPAGVAGGRDVLWS
jgi:hypothetical protein